MFDYSFWILRILAGFTIAMKVAIFIYSEILSDESLVHSSRSIICEIQLVLLLAYLISCKKTLIRNIIASLFTLLLLVQNIYLFNSRNKVYFLRFSERSDRIDIDTCLRILDILTSPGTVVLQGSNIKNLKLQDQLARYMPGLNESYVITQRLAKFHQIVL